MQTKLKIPRPEVGHTILFPIEQFAVLKVKHRLANKIRMGNSNSPEEYSDISFEFS